jgi:hypothetical protein
MSSNIIFCEEQKKDFIKERLIGIFYNKALIDDKGYADMIDLRLQTSYRINNFPIIPYQEADIKYSITDTNPRYSISLLFGFKNYFIEDESGFTFSGDLGIGGIAGNKKDNKSLFGIAYRISLSLGYKNINFCYGVDFNSGLPYQSTLFAGLNYKW